MLLGDFGADVIRVERREGGEDRYVGPVVDSGEGGLFLNINRNKRGITLDPAHPQSREIVRRLIRSADIAVVNLPIDVMRKLSLDYDSMRAIKDNIILVMASAFGPDGPYNERVGFDGIAQAMSGAMSLTGSPDMPIRSIVSWADYGTALHAAFGAMAALYDRERTGRGQLIDVSLLATGVTFMQPLLMERALTGIIRERMGNTSFYTAPGDVYRTRDGWIIVPTIGNVMFRRWARLVGREDLIDDPRFSDDISRANNCNVINQIMSDWCSDRSRDDAVAALESARIPCGPVYSLDEVLADPQVEARRLFEEVHFGGGGKPIPVTNTPVRLSETPASIRRQPPALGEHTDEVLAELGFAATEIQSFRTAGVI
jgi:crotonobetainyl-CoA:carnitine CoA-transferase CaiB-like acyl-CoA transferase